MAKTFTLLFVTAIIFLSANAQQTMQKTLYHEYDKTSLTSISQQEYNDLIQQIKQLDIISVSIQSYADQSGSSEYNQQLSKRRNDFILQELKSQLPDSIHYTTGYFGESHLLSSDEGQQANNRRTDIIVLYNKKRDNDQTEMTELVPYNEDVTEQRYEVNLDDSVSITANNGTLITFPPATFQNNKHQTATGKAVLLIKEYYNPADIILSGMHSLSDNGLLQTGGMINLRVLQNSDTMMAETKKPVRLSIPDYNNLGGSMNVFTTNYVDSNLITDHGDTSLWNDTRRNFSYTASSWNWPGSYNKLKDFYIEKGIRFYDWNVGRTYRNEYHTSSPAIYFGKKRDSRSFEKPMAKYVSYTVTKKDSVTLSVNLSERFKRRGYRKFNMRTFDTTFLVKYFYAKYETLLTTGINLINCDRFYDYPKLTDFYVKTAACKGASVLVYFKNINAFMPATYNKDHYEIKNVPAGEDVYVIAVGRKDDDFYYCKKATTIKKKETANIALQQVKYDEMKKVFSTLGYQK